MATYILYPDFNLSAAALNRSALAISRAVAWKILMGNDMENYAYSRLLWQGKDELLMEYFQIYDREWKRRGYVSNLSFDDSDPIIQHEIPNQWMEHPGFFDSHRCMYHRYYPRGTEELEYPSYMQELGFAVPNEGIFSPEIQLELDITLFNGQAYTVLPPYLLQPRYCRCCFDDNDDFYQIEDEMDFPPSRCSILIKDPDSNFCLRHAKKYANTLRCEHIFRRGCRAGKQCQNRVKFDPDMESDIKCKYHKSSDKPKAISSQCKYVYSKGKSSGKQCKVMVIDKEYCSQHARSQACQNPANSKKNLPIVKQFQVQGYEIVSIKDKGDNVTVQYLKL